MKLINFVASLLLAVFIVSCSSEKKLPSGWRHSDDVYIAIDETFQPIMDEELKTFCLLHIEAHPKPTYCSEDSAIRMLLMDSIRSCVVTRELSEKEKDYIKSRSLGISWALIATDALALITNKENPHELITVDEIKGIVTGKITRWEQLRNSARKGKLSLVFDHSGSSTVRYMRDSLCGGEALQGNLYAQGTNQAVIEAVKNDPSLIGVVGTNWLKGKDQQVITDFSDSDVFVMKVSKDKDEDPVGFRPYQYRIATGDYPLLRSVYVMHTDPRRDSNVALFYFFLKGQKGQTIICNGSQLLPITPVQVKAVSITDKK
ncbi:phosphate ABC transporter, phosphate-binding component [gut metagenome]|uniref:Phosphate ABC transporter, phosphate-binding component n=1 Tax=gut metagenome TaxID=749906 RepID=J9GH00_9ZZZZ